MKHEQNQEQTQKLKLPRSFSLTDNLKRTSLKTQDKSKKISDLTNRKQVFSSRFKLNQIQHTPGPSLVNSDPTLDEIMNKVKQIKAETELRSSLYVDTTVIKPNNQKQVTMLHMEAHFIRPTQFKDITKYNLLKKSESSSPNKKITIIQDPKTRRDRFVNFLIKQSKQAEPENIHQAKEIYKNLNQGELNYKTEQKIQNLFQKASLQELSSPTKQKILINSRYLNIQSPQESPRKKYKSTYEPKTTFKYQIPFIEKQEKKQKFLKKGANITGMVFKQIFKDDRKRKIDDINCQKLNFLEQYNQTVPEQLNKQWKSQVFQSLKLLKGANFKPKQVPIQLEKTSEQIQKRNSIRDFSRGFDLNQIIYLSDQKNFHKKQKLTLNDYYQTPLGSRGI